jgi:hypothetical protein
MKNHRSALLAGILLIACLGPAHADSVVQVWLCDLNEGKTRTDVLELSAAWIEAAKSLDGGKGIKAHIEFPMVADNTCDFRFVMTADTIRTWARMTDSQSPLNAAYAKSAMAKIDEAWYGLAVCSSSTLWNSVEIK